MRVAFRVDASTRIGSGHVMRCMALADALSRSGAECTFITRAHTGNMDQRIREAGYRVLTLGPPQRDTTHAGESDYASWLDVTQGVDAHATQEILNGSPADCVIVDHYALDRTWESRISEGRVCIAVIDDLANRPHACNMLIDHNWFPDPELRYRDRVGPDCTTCLGPRYALIRTPYREYRSPGPPWRKGISRILVYFGGVDPDDLTGATLQALNRPEFTDIQVDLVIGASNPYRDALEQQVARRPHSVVHGPRPHLADLMARADVAIGAGGTTTWERCAIGLPGIVIAIAHNQCELSSALHSQGAIRYLGHVSDVPDAAAAIAATLSELRSDPAASQAMREAAWCMVDGYGCERVAEILWREHALFGGPEYG